MPHVAAASFKRIEKKHTLGAGHYRVLLLAVHTGMHELLAELLCDSPAVTQGQDEGVGLALG